jgi:hypothetical protein
MNSEYRKINEAEMVIGLCMATMVYVLCFIFDSFMIGVVVSPVIQSFFTLGSWFFFKSHGDPHASKLNANLVQYLANLIPFVPAPIANFGVKMWIHNRQQIAGIANKIASKV